jgi:hypothetical protein
MLGSFPHPTSCTHILAHPGGRGHPWLGKGFPGNPFRIFTYGDVPLIMGGSRVAAAAVARGRWPMAMPSTDSDELAKFGYKQELDRSLGLFSSFAAGFSYISIMTGVFELFFFGCATSGLRPTTARTSRWAAGGCR